MKTLKKLTSTSFMIIVCIALGLNANAQTATVAVVNNTDCDMQVGMAGDYGSVTCGVLEAEGEALNVNARSTLNVPFVDSKFGTLTSAFLRGAGALAHGGSSSNAINNLCTSTSTTGTSSSASCPSYTVTITITPTTQTITIN